MVTRSRALRASYHSAPPQNGPSPAQNYDRPARLKGREEGIIRWAELLDKFRAVQERARRAQLTGSEHGNLEGNSGSGAATAESRQDIAGAKSLKDNNNRLSGGNLGPVRENPAQPPPGVPPKKLGLGRQFGRLGGAVAGRGKR